MAKNKTASRKKTKGLSHVFLILLTSTRYQVN